MNSISADFSDCVFVAVAAGRGARLGGDLPKQYQRVAGRTVLEHCLLAISRAAPGALIQPVIHAADRALFAAAVARLPASVHLLEACPGGATRQDSVLAGLKAIRERDNSRKIVLIHDVARIIVSNRLVENLVAGARETGAAIPVVAIPDSLRRQEAPLTQAPAGASRPVPRDGLYAVQTPQAFAFPAILAAHEQAAAAGHHDFTDDASLAEWSGLVVKTISGDPLNRKITTPGDLHMAELMLFANLADVRTGSGYDVHAFCPGDHVWIGGVRIPHVQALEGHSDADAVLHALTDALLGAIADGDIGVHFPPSDPQWKGAPSHLFVRDAVRRVQARGGMIAHLDLTVVCEAPRIGPHRDAIRAAISEMTGVEIERISIKATTSEGLGFTGRREGMAASAIATVRLPLAEARK